MEHKLLSFGGHEVVKVEVPVWDVYGRKLHVGKIGEAIVAKAWIDGKPIYNLFASIEALHAWVRDAGMEFDAVDTVAMDLAA